MRAEGRDITLDASRMWELVEEQVYAFELDFREGKSRPLDEYLPEGDAALRHIAIVELVKVDLELQWKSGARKDLAEYCEQYADLGSLATIPPDLVYEAYLVADRYGDDVCLAEFCEAFPQQRTAVLALAHRTVVQSTAMTRQKPRGEWQVGTRVGDFLLLANLGEGAFGKVFLARQISLGRQIALKVTANIGSEAHTMATLEHDNIVQVFSEVILPEVNSRLLCMQYVPGTTLGKIIRQLSLRSGEAPETGERFLEVVDELSAVPAAFQAAGFKERQLLTESDWIETATILGSRLAGALAYAHERGILHRDIKPDNILVSQYGRPLLVDFNLAIDSHQFVGVGTGLFGGSLRYMAPEHLEAMNPVHPTSPEAVDERSDVYSLGVVLYELLNLQRPFREPVAGRNQVEVLAELAAERHEPLPAPSPDRDEATDVLDGVIRRCLEPDPNARFQSAGDLCQALDATRELHEIRKALPEPGRLTAVAMRRPLLVLVLAVFIPNLIGSGVNISYNMLRIVSHLTQDQVAVFERTMIGYNLFIYPICVALMVWQALPIFWRRSQDTAAEIRRRIARLSIWIVALCLIGWLPGGIVFPLVLHVAAGPLQPAIFGHFLVDFAISGLVAITYSYFGAEAILLRVLYPRFSPARRSRDKRRARNSR